MTFHDTTSGVGDDLARQVAESNVGRASLCPGNATRYDIVVAAVEGEGLLIALTNFDTAHVFPDAHDVHWSYVADKLKLGMADAQVIAETMTWVAVELRRLAGKEVAL